MGISRLLVNLLDVIGLVMSFITVQYHMGAKFYIHAITDCV